MIKIGRYEVIAELGRGAMGIVYKAQDPTIGRLVAIKVLSLDAPTDVGVPDARDIFMREARAAGRLSHPGIVTIHDALEDPESRSSYIVMEFIPGKTLESILLDSPSLGAERAFNIIRQIAEALDYAHQNQIIHRDLKPANILVTEDGRIKITDFGIAKIVARESASRTVAIMGTPSYMSPEQITGGELDSRADLFSMGILFYLMLTGQKPFAGDTVAVMFKIVHEDPVLPSRLNPQLTPGLDYVVLRSLAKDRAKRYSSAREFLEDLEDVQQRRSPRSQVRVLPAELHAGEKTIVASKPLLGAVDAQPATSAPQTSRRTLGIVGGGALAIVAALGFWVLRHREAPTPPPSSTTATAPPAAVPAAAPAKNEAANPPEETSQPGRQMAAKGPNPLPPPSQPKPASGLAVRATQPTSEPVKPAAVAARSSPAAPDVAATASPRVVYLIWQHDLKEAVLTVRSNGATIYQGNLTGKKKGGFLGIKGTYAAIVKRPISIPAGSRELELHISSKESGPELDAKVTAVAPADPSAALRVEARDDHLTAGWQVTQGGKP
ncbi:MAG: serine/threonine protein kinase [Acidobacteriia bacterium]|nr:serine/threonine protein kinase [Terriglobia bacterium]